MTELSGLELRRAFAEKIGWTELHLCLHGELYGFDPKTGLEMQVPSYEALCLAVLKLEG